MWGQTLRCGRDDGRRRCSAHLHDMAEGHGRHHLGGLEEDARGVVEVVERPVGEVHTTKHQRRQHQVPPQRALALEVAREQHFQGRARAVHDSGAQREPPIELEPRYPVRVSPPPRFYTKTGVGTQAGVGGGGGFNASPVNPLLQSGEC